MMRAFKNMTTIPVTPNHNNNESLIFSNKWLTVFPTQLSKHLARWAEGPCWGHGVERIQK